MPCYHYLEMPELPEQSFSDKKLEVVAVYSSFHMAQLQVGLSTPHYIGQASSVKVFSTIWEFFQNLILHVKAKFLHEYCLAPQPCIQGFLGS